jgi:hypothetical protein
VFYGLSVIVGTGIYGRGHRARGQTAPFVFCSPGLPPRLPASVARIWPADFRRRPERSHVRHGFGSDRLALVTAVAPTVVIAVATASIPDGVAANYGTLAAFGDRCRRHRDRHLRRPGECRLRRCPWFPWRSGAIKGASRNDRNRMEASTVGSPCRRRGYAFPHACQGRHCDDR